MLKLLKKIGFFVLVVVSCNAKIAYAQSLPGSADPGRILQDQAEQLRPLQEQDPFFETEDAKSVAPSGADKLIFTLNSVQIEGLTAFEIELLQKFYVDKVGQDIPASFIWELAAQITGLYRDEGYFLARAFVPAQKIDTGDIRIEIIEGYIADLEIEGTEKESMIVDAIARSIKEQRPIKIKHLESQLLRLGDLYGMKFDAVLSKKKDGQDGSVVLSLKQKKSDEPRLTIAANNYGSRFVGPYRTGITYEDSIIDFNKTTVTISAALPEGDELRLASLNHRVQVAPSVELDFLISQTKSRPGFTLKQSDVESDSFSWGFGAQWTPLRQRDKNLKLFTRITGLNSNTDTLGVPFTRDRIRTIRAGGQYDFIDRFAGLNVLSLTISRGLRFLGASDEDDLNLSRSDASSNFTKIEASFNRQDFIADNMLLNLNVRGQLSSRSLFSSEEFGYGGINIGRAYDFSEITGDHGISALAELLYTGFKKQGPYQIRPFIFYDFGKVWNEGNVAVKSISGSSAGLGARIFGDNGLNLDATVAFPLTKSIDTPLQGGNGHNPVFRVGATYQYDFK